MNRSLRALPAAAVLVGILAACAPAGDEGVTPTDPVPSTDVMASHSMGSMPSASASAQGSSTPMGSHDMGGMDGSAGETVTVDITNFAFTQDRIEISVGDTVRWVNGDGTRHTITSGTDDAPDGAFDSGDVAAGDKFELTFADAGEFAYFCDIHPTMTGVVVVTP